MAASGARVSAPFAAIRRARHVILLFWATLTVLGALYAQRFTANTNIDFDVPPAAKGYESAQLFKRIFPADSVKVSALVKRIDGGPVLGDSLRALTRSLRAFCAENGINATDAVVGYYTLVDAGLAQAAGPFVSNPQQPNASTASIVVVSLPTIGSDALAGGLAERARMSGSGLDVKLAGEPYFLQAALDGVTHDVEHVHPKVLPFAFIPFLWIVRSWRLSLVTLACIASTAASSFFVMFLVSAHVDVANFAPSMMLSATIATSIDYSLFLLSRFREELADDESDGSAADEALDVALRYAGHTVLVSGSTLALCFFGLLFFPVSIISSLGLATGITIVLSICANLTLLPALILSCPRFFAATGCCAGRAASADAPRRLPAPLVSTAAAQRTMLGGAFADSEEEERATSAGVPLTRKDADRLAAALARRAQSQGTCWARVSGASIRHGWVAVLVFCVLGGLFGKEAFSIRTSQTQQEMMPRTAQAAIAYTQMVDIFGAGSIFPFQLLIAPHDGVVESDAFFERARKIVRRTTELAGAAELLNASGVMLSGAEDVPFELVRQALHADETKCALLAKLLGRPVCELVRLGWRQFTDGDAAAGRNASATFVSLAPTFDPFTPRGTRVIDALRAALETAAAEAGSVDTVGLVGGAISMNDCVSLVYAYFPLMVGVTLSVVFALLAAAFRSLVVPLRAVATISVSLLVTMGAAWLVYGRGWLNGLGWDAVGMRGSLAWSAPVLAFPIMVGLGLDYDIFLLGRILEYRLLGFGESESIAAGVEHSGPLITAAGVIMAIAFGALLFSSSTSLNELAFLLTASVLVDTFVVRTVLVPSAMGIIGAANWWPRKLPPPVPRVDLLPLRTHGALPSEREEHGAPAVPPAYESVDAADSPHVAPVVAARFVDSLHAEGAPPTEQPRTSAAPRGDEEDVPPGRGHGEDVDSDGDSSSTDL